MEEIHIHVKKQVKRRDYDAEAKALLDCIGFVSYDVQVNCPYCNKKLHLNQYPYNHEESEYYLPELGKQLFGGIDNPAKWSLLAIEYKCCGCKQICTLSGFEL